MFTRACHLSLSCARRIQSMLAHPISLRYLLILSSYLCLGLPSGLFPSGFLTKTLQATLLPPLSATSSANFTPSLFDHLSNRNDIYINQVLSALHLSLIAVKIPSFQPSNSVLPSLHLVLLTRSCNYPLLNIICQYRENIR
jgi:hypothetical protein